MSADLADAFRQVASNMARVADSPYIAAMTRVIDRIDAIFAGGHKLLVLGNGGSAADAEHLTAELVGRFQVSDRPPLPAIALTTNQAFLTAWSNDRTFDEVFSRQIEAFGRPGDAVWAISTSGTSPNVLQALRTARALGLVTIGMTGAGGTALADLCDVLLAVPLTETARVQEVHLVTYHLVCRELEHRAALRAQ